VDVRADRAVPQYTPASRRTLGLHARDLTPYPLELQQPAQNSILKKKTSDRERDEGCLCDAASLRSRQALSSV
jgi:hypothetical protein